MNRPVYARQGRLALAVLVLGACAAKPSAPEPAVFEPPSSSIRFARAEPASGRSWLDAPATVLAGPEATASLSAPLTARVVRVRVRRGEHVNAEQPLIDVVMPELIRAAGALSAASIRIDAYDRRRLQVERLLEQGLARASELAELEAQLAVARADRESARATLRSAGVRDADAAALLREGGALALRAPIAGTVVAISTQLGEVREPASGPLLELAGAADVQIEARLAYVPPAQARFVWSGPERELALALEAVSPRASVRDGTRLAWFHVAEGDRVPAPGTAGVVRTEPPHDAVAVPLAALAEGEGGAFVTVQRAGTEQRTPVQVLARGSAEAVVSGLVPGAELVLGAEPTR